MTGGLLPICEVGIIFAPARCMVKPVSIFYSLATIFNSPGRIPSIGTPFRGGAWIPFFIQAAMTSSHLSLFKGDDALSLGIHCFLWGYARTVLAILRTAASPPCSYLQLTYPLTGVLPER